MVQKNFPDNAGGSIGERQGMCLLELIAVQMDCTYLSDLRHLSCGQRRCLAEKLKRITPMESDLRDWNDALQYLTENKELKATAQEAKSALIAGLAAPE